MQTATLLSTVRLWKLLGIIFSLNRLLRSTAGHYLICYTKYILKGHRFFQMHLVSKSFFPCQAWCIFPSGFMQLQMHAQLAPDLLFFWVGKWQRNYVCGTFQNLFWKTGIPGYHLTQRQQLKRASHFEQKMLHLSQRAQKESQIIPVFSAFILPFTLYCSRLRKHSPNNLDTGDIVRRSGVILPKDPTNCIPLSE